MTKCAPSLSKFTKLFIADHPKTDTDIIRSSVYCSRMSRGMFIEAGDIHVIMFNFWIIVHLPANKMVKKAIKH